MSELCEPLEYGGWCQKATTHGSVFASRSASSHSAIGAPGARFAVMLSRLMKWTRPQFHEK